MKFSIEKSDEAEGSETQSNKGLEIIIKIKTKKIQRWRFFDFILTPSQNFLAENFNLPQGEGDEPVGVETIIKKGTRLLFY